MKRLFISQYFSNLKIVEQKKVYFKIFSIDNKKVMQYGNKMLAKRGYTKLLKH